MAAPDRELFERLRAVGLRREIAQSLSGLGADARKKSIRAARAAIAELRALADELEQRLPTGHSAPAASEPAPTGTKPAGNRAAILAALATGPMTASEIAAETGISVSTVSTALTRMTRAGELAKAPRGYALPS